jgi:hypothetical protein
LAARPFTKRSDLCTNENFSALIFSWTTLIA